MRLGTQSHLSFTRKTHWFHLCLFCWGVWSPGIFGANRKFFGLCPDSFDGISQVFGRKWRSPRPLCFGFGWISVSSQYRYEHWPHARHRHHSSVFLLWGQFPALLFYSQRAFASPAWFTTSAWDIISPMADKNIHAVIQLGSKQFLIKIGTKSSPKRQSFLRTKFSRWPKSYWPMMEKKTQIGTPFLDKVTIELAYEETKSRENPSSQVQKLSPLSSCQRTPTDRVTFYCQVHRSQIMNFYSLSVSGIPSPKPIGTKLVTPENFFQISIL